MKALTEAEIHEAAHAAIAFVLGQTPTTVTVWGGDRGGLTRTRVPAGAGADQDHMVVLLAGVLAARLFGHDVPRDGRDQREARGLALKVAGWPARGDVGFEVADWIHRHAARRAEQLVRDHRDAIASVAAALRANGGRLAGVELDRALKAAFARPSVRVAGAAASDVDFAEMVLRLHRGRSANWRSLLVGSGRGRSGARSQSILISPKRR